MHQACLSFVSQNRGAGNQKRIGQTLRSCMLLSIGIGLGFAALYLTCGQYLLRFYTPDPAVVEYGMVRLRSVVGPYLFYGIMEMACAAMRGLGYSLLPAMVSLGGVCITRLLWVHTVFAWYPQLWVLFLAWPVSWAVTGAIHLCCYAAARKKAVS